MRNATLFGAAVAAAVTLIPSTVFAHGGRPVAVFTDTVKGSATVPFSGPCGGAPGTVSIAYQDTFHVTQFADGHSVVTGNQAGTFDFESSDPAAPDSTGRYRNGFSSTFTQNAATSTSVFTVVGRDDNGDQVRFQVRSTFTFANGDVRVDHFTVSCP